MGQRLIISEEERNSISSIYKLINEQESYVANPTQRIILDSKDKAVIGTYDEKRRTNQKNFLPNQEGKKRGFKESDELPQGVKVQKVDQTSKFNKLVETRQGDVKPFVNESEFETNMPLRLRGTFEGETTTREITIYLKFVKFRPTPSASGELEFEWSYRNAAPAPADMIGSFNCRIDSVRLPGSGDVSAFVGKIYDDTALMKMKNFCKAGQTREQLLSDKQPNSTKRAPLN